MRQNRCAVCRKRIRRSNRGQARMWLGPGNESGPGLGAELLEAHPGCTIPADMKASPREMVVGLANYLLARVREDGSERGRYAAKLYLYAATGSRGWEEKEEVVDRWLALPEDEFREEMEESFARFGMSVSGRATDGFTTLRREGIDPE